MRWPFATHPRLTLGTYANGFPLWPASLTLRGAEIHTHKHLIGLSGFGKSKLLESLFLQLFAQGIAVSFLDPHSDSARNLLKTLLRRGYFRHEVAFDRLLYIEFSDAGPYLPFNVLNQAGVDPKTTARMVLEACHRAWPALADGAAPQFDNLILAGAVVLRANGLPLPAMHQLLTNAPYRDRLLSNLADYQVASFFTDRFDRWSKAEAPQMIESTLRRIFLWQFDDVLLYSLGQTDNALDFRRIIDQGTSVIYDLGLVRNQEARRLLGCLITIGYESAALSRTDLDDLERKPHHLILDEFSDYSAQSEEALARTLSLTRKFGLYATMAHQTWSQTSERLQGALQNVRVKVAMQVGRQDAEILARLVGYVDPYQIKAEALSETAQPLYMDLPSQWEGWIQQLTSLPIRNALVSVTGRPTVVLKTPTMPTPAVDPERLTEVRREYRRRLMTPREELEPRFSRSQPSPIRRSGPVATALLK